MEASEIATQGVVTDDNEATDMGTDPVTDLEQVATAEVTPKIVDVTTTKKTATLLMQSTSIQSTPDLFTTSADRTTPSSSSGMFRNGK